MTEPELPNQEHEPPVHIVREGDKWGVCLSRLGKWVAGVTATLFTLAISGSVGLQINNTVELSRQGENIKAIWSRLDHMDSRMTKRMDGLDHDIDGKADK